MSYCSIEPHVKSNQQFGGPVMVSSLTDQAAKLPET